MRRLFFGFAACAGALWLLGGTASAEAEDAAPADDMRALVRQLEARVDAQARRIDAQDQQLRATRDELDASKGEVTRQNQLLEKAGIERQGGSGLSGFFSAVEVSGWVAADWFWNFNDPSEDVLGFGVDDEDGPIGVNQGGSGAFYPYHPDHNSFSLAQLWFEIEKPVTEESRGGFRADLAYGRTAGLLSGGSFNRANYDNASDFNLYQAYVQYLVPGLEATLVAGKFGTIAGAEVAPTIYNFNITRGAVFNLMQPVTHTGVTLAGEAGPVGYRFGVANAGVATHLDPDFNNAKSLLGQLSVGGETFGLAANLVWGMEGVGDSGCNCSQGLFDVVATLDPMERFSAWLNFDYRWGDSQGGPTSQEAWGLALAGRVGITEALGFAVRGEWLQDRNNLFGLDGPDDGSSTIWTLTGTLDYELTENLLVRAEVRWDDVDTDEAADGEFIKKAPSIDGGDVQFTNRDQVTTGMEIVYQF
jgi:hypothetical protein